MPPPFKKFDDAPPKKEYAFEVILLLAFIAIFGFGLIVLLYSKILELRFLAIAFLNRAKPIGITVDILLLVGTIYAFVRSIPLRPKFTLLGKLPPAKSSEVARDPEVAKHFAAILAKASTDKPDDLRLAIIEADALVDTYLKKLGYEGEHMADRLSQIIPEEVGSLEALWRAHRMRNEVVHTPGFAVTPAEGRDALKSFELFLTDLGAL